jgi:hypothetical protein
MLLAASERWGWRGSALAIGLALVVSSLAGELQWARPHERYPWLSSSRELACDVTGYLPALLLLGLAVSITLHFVRNSEFGIRASAALLATVVAAVPALFLQVWWGIQVLRCDVL